MIMGWLISGWLLEGMGMGLVAMIFDGIIIGLLLDEHRLNCIFDWPLN